MKSKTLNSVESFEKTYTTKKYRAVWGYQDLAKVPAMQKQAAQSTSVNSDSDADPASDSNSDEEFEGFVYHFTGKMNQSQVMKTMAIRMLFRSIISMTRRPAKSIFTELAPATSTMRLAPVTRYALPFTEMSPSKIWSGRLICRVR